MRVRRLVQIALVALVALVPGARTGAEDGPNPWTFLPTRALAVDGGVISFQSGVGCDRDPRRFHPTLLPNPTQYFVVVTNERDAPIWVALQWRFPGEQPTLVGGKIEARRFAVPYWRSDGLVAGSAIPFKIWIHADAERTRELAVKETSFLFPEDEKAGFLDAIHDSLAKGVKADTRACPVLSGWQDMKDFGAVVAGSAADPKLQQDIKVLLGKEQSKAGWECRHEVLEAVPVRAAEPGGLRVERWTVKSCETVTRYEVAMVRAPDGRTDLRVERAP